MGSGSEHAAPEQDTTALCWKMEAQALQPPCIACAKSSLEGIWSPCEGPGEPRQCHFLMSVLPACLFCLSLHTPTGRQAQHQPQLPHSLLWMSLCHMGISKSLGCRARKQNLGRQSACLCWKGHAWIFFLAKPLKKMQLKTKTFFDLQNQPCAWQTRMNIMNSLSAELDWSGQTSSWLIMKSS